MKIAISGANSRVGQTLIEHILQHSEHTVLAGVRSTTAFASLTDSPRVTPVVISYSDPETLTQTLAGADCLVHLAGILIEGKGSSYQSANIDATAAVVEAARKVGIEHLVFISVVGAHRTSANAYFKSKGLAEELVEGSGIASTIIRTPILLGLGSAGAAAIKWAASKPKPKLLGGGDYTMRPLDIDDLCVAIVNSCVGKRQGSVTHELVGPQAITYRALIEQAAALQGVQIEVGSIPIWIAKLGATVTGIFRQGGMSATVIDVITMDDVVDRNGDQALGVTLTPLPQTLQKFLSQ